MARELQPLDVKLTTYRDLTDPSDNSRPPDAGIRGITAIIQTAMASTSQMMAAAPQGLNIVVNGTGSAAGGGASQRITGINSGLLAAGALAGVVAAYSKKSSKPDAKADVKNAAAPAKDTKPEEKAESKDVAGTEPTPVEPTAENKDETPPAGDQETPPVDDKAAKGENGTHSKPVKKRHGAVKKQPVKTEEKTTNGGDVSAEVKPLDEDTNGDGVLNSDDDLDKNGDGVLNSDDDVQAPVDEIAGSTDGGDPISTSEPPPDGETSGAIPAGDDLDISTS